MLSLLLVALLSQTNPPKVEFPPVISGEPNNFITILPTTNGKTVKYAYIDKGLNVFPSSLLANPIATVVTAPKGKYRLLAYTALGDVPSDPAIVIINVGNVPDSAPFGPFNPTPIPPTPPAPNPPAPNPPAPNPPGPMPPQPEDALASALVGIYGGLKDQDRNAADKVAKLALIYREGARAAINTDVDPNTGKPFYNTVGDVYAKVNTLGKEYLKEQDIYDIRDRLRVEMNGLLPRNSTLVLDNNVRALLNKEFSRYASILEKLQ
jgi:hypothetical protein